MLGLNSANYDLTFLESYLLPILGNEGDIEPIVIKKASQFIWFKFRDIQQLDKMK